MKKKIQIAKVISTDVRSRSNADIIRNEISKDVNEVILDFAGVVFISRSFADELYTIMDKHKDVKVQEINMSEIVSSMMNAVSSGRKKVRVRPVNNSEIKEFDDLESLSAFLVQ